jgi:aspartyl-tRNA synthetase
MLRTHNLGSLQESLVGERLTLCGWVARVRAVGEINFVVLRDRYGTVQLKIGADLLSKHRLSREDCLRVMGTLEFRPMADRTKDRNGSFEVLVNELEILNESDVPPFVVDGKEGASEDLRLKHRHLDLRSRFMTENLVIRHRVVDSIRNSLNSLDFLEVETPMLMKSMPEGARDFLVPSRAFPGEFYALPQSPQIYKQIIQVAGLDRYYQFARCFRDEDTRNDRQLVHTQMDLEMSFVEEGDVFNVIESTLETLFQEILGQKIQVPFERMCYDDAIRRFGTDKPDLRFSLELIDLDPFFKGTTHPAIAGALEGKGRVAGIAVPGGSCFSRKEIDGFSEFVKTYRADGAFYLKCTDDGFSSGATKLVPESLRKGLWDHCKVQSGDLLFFIAGDQTTVSDALGHLRNEVARALEVHEGNFIDKDSRRFLWVTDFPLFEYDQDLGTWQAMHHMFTMPKEEHLKYLETGELDKVYGRLYDLVLNGVELGSGSIRIHRAQVQKKVFEAIGMSPEDTRQRFGFFLDSLRHGAPPHGGIALGVARLVMTLLGLENMRDVIAFPHASSSRYLLDDSPTSVDSSQLEELSIRTVIKNP